MGVHDHESNRERERDSGSWGVWFLCVATVSLLICSDSQWLLHFTQSTWLSHLHTLPPDGQWVEVQLHAVAVLKKKEKKGGGGGETKAHDV